jgi:hypothetical protein
MEPAIDYDAILNGPDYLSCERIPGTPRLSKSQCRRNWERALALKTAMGAHQTGMLYGCLDCPAHQQTKPLKPTAAQKAEVRKRAYPIHGSKPENKRGVCLGLITPARKRGRKAKAKANMPRDPQPCPVDGCNEPQYGKAGVCFRHLLVKVGVNI